MQNNIIQELAKLWKQYLEETKELRKAPENGLTDELKAQGRIYFKGDFSGFMDWLAAREEPKESVWGAPYGVPLP